MLLVVLELLTFEEENRFVEEVDVLLVDDDWKADDDFRTVTIGGGGGFSGFSMYLRSTIPSEHNVKDCVGGNSRQNAIIITF